MLLKTLLFLFFKIKLLRDYIISYSYVIFLIQNVI